GFDTAPRNDPMTVIGGLSGEALAGRGEGAREAMVAKYGGTKESEEAVARALQWLAAHQLPDGGWSFMHNLAPGCRRRCGNPGDPRFAQARNAATGLALLPFLGAGQTHKEGRYQKVVQSGLYFLINRQDRRSGSLWDSSGQMYSHGIASIALCEAYAMTHDKMLFEPAQKAINFIVYAQDPFGGGWRYVPQQPGDTSILGWQIMALKSGHLAYLVVPPATVKKASGFLDSVQSPDGANYGYDKPGEGPSTEATTAIGVLCRMLMGRKKSDPDLELGVAWLSRRGPNSSLYYDYYATQVLRHWEGEPWTKWNAVMRDELVNLQAKRGHELGSWFIMEEGNHLARHNQIGGRLYCTALAAMILEVYYRHMPIYAKQSVESDFPLE
ncbi:MAG: terpene cyclase/mutase family protein, partial [Pirellulales bacterium]|nr:terpene cyclase/mutase family protein [Pirellulales bacterium]